mmetsp:Transcript_69332/g.109553  ORF Transcript_69332/g.109553 Transcript_69332/m.109553 type:complete len:392 (+) Transcript_69332:94-1269(+)
MTSSAWELASGGKEPGIAALFKGASLINTKGEAVSIISALKDRTVLLYFAASWAEPCKFFNKLLAMFNEAVRAKGDESIAVIFVSNDKSKEEQLQFFNDESIHRDWLMAEWTYDLQDIMDQYNVEKIPWLLVADREGKAVVKDASEALFAIFTDQASGRLKKQEETQAAAEAKWSEWRRLAGDWRASEGHTLGGSASAVSSTNVVQASAQNDREALRAARLAALERRNGTSVPVSASTGSSSSSAPPPVPTIAPAPVALATLGGSRIVGLGGIDAGNPRTNSTASGSGTFASGASSIVGGTAYTLSGGKMDLPPTVPIAPMSVDDEVASDMASIDAAESDRDDLDGDVAIEIEEAVSRVTAMGFPEQQAREALQVTNGDPDRAVALLLGDT